MVGGGGARCLTRLDTLMRADKDEEDDKYEFCSLRGLSISAVPNTVRFFCNLRVVDLSFNQLHVLPEEVGMLVQMTHLYLNWNRLSSLPASMAKLEKLEELHLWANHINNFPPALAHMSKLRVLDLSNNRLGAIPRTIGSLTDLTTLNLAQNQLAALPGDIGKLAVLRKLNLADNLITAFPETIGDLSSLQVLFAQNNKLGTLPKQIGSLAKLEMLSLHRNNLKLLPTELGKLTALRKLNLTSNKLAVLPPVLGNLTLLEHMGVSDNPIRTPPPNVCREPTKFLLEFLRRLVAVSSSELPGDLAKALNQRQYHDLTFLVSDRPIFCHKVIVASRCPYFRNLLIKGSASEFPITDTSYATFLEFCRYLYSGALSAGLAEDQLAQLAMLAKKYKLNGLATICDGGNKAAESASDLAEAFRKELNNDKFADVTFVVDKTSIKAHRAIVCHRSTALEKAINKRTTGGAMLLKVPVADVGAAEFRIVLEYLYTDNIPVSLDYDTTLAVLAAADLFQLRRLKELSENVLQNHVAIDTAAALFREAHNRNASQLRAFVQEFIVAHHSAVSATAGFASLSLELKDELSKLKK